MEELTRVDMIAHHRLSFPARVFLHDHEFQDVPCGTETFLERNLFHERVRAARTSPESSSY